MTPINNKQEILHLIFRIYLTRFLVFNCVVILNLNTVFPKKSILTGKKKSNKFKKKKTNNNA